MRYIFIQQALSEIIATMNAHKREYNLFPNPTAVSLKNTTLESIRARNSEGNFLNPRKSYFLSSETRNGMDFRPVPLGVTDDVISHKNNTKQRHVSGQICSENII